MAVKDGVKWNVAVTVKLMWQIANRVEYLESNGFTISVNKRSF